MRIISLAGKIEQNVLEQNFQLSDLSLVGYFENLHKLVVFFDELTCMEYHLLFAEVIQMIRHEIDPELLVGFLTQVGRTTNSTTKNSISDVVLTWASSYIRGKRRSVNCVQHFVHLVAQRPD